MRLFRHSKNSDYFLKIFLFLFSLIYIIIFSILQISKFNNFDPSCYQIGWISYSAWNFFNHGTFQLQYNVIKKLPDFIFFMPVNFFIFFMPPYTEILLILQNIIIILTIIPIYLLANHILKNAYMVLALTLSFLLHPIIHFASISGFSPEIIALPALMFAFYYFEKGNFTKSLIFIILSNICRISVLFMILLWSLCLFFSKKNKKYAKTVFLTNFIWLSSFLIFLFLLKYQENLQGLLHLELYGKNLQETTHKLLNTPFIFFHNLVDNKNLYILLNILIPLVFLPLLSPFSLVPLFFSLIYIFLIHNNTAELCFIIPFIYLSAIYGAKKFITWAQYKQKFIIAFFACMTISSFISHYYLHLPWHTPIPFSKNADWGSYRLTKHNEIGHKLLKLIPQKASVLAQYPLDQHLTYRTKLDRLNQETVKNDWDFVFLDTSSPSNFLTPPDYNFMVEHFLANNSYRIVFNHDGWLLLKKEYPDN